MKPKTYLGDGVFAGFDGFQVWIWASDGIRESEKIALDDSTLAALNAYYERCRTHAATTHSNNEKGAGTE